MKKGAETIKVNCDGDIPNLKCGTCIYFNVKGDREPCNCKRIDHKTIKFAKPWFSSYDCNQRKGIICSEYLPNPMYIDIYSRWTTFEEYWEQYVEQWLPYGNTNITIAFILNNNEKIRYNVPLLDYVYGRMTENGQLKAVSKSYYVRDRSSLTGYRLVTEDLN